MSFQFQVTADYGLVELILSNPRAYKLMANDEAPALKDFKVQPGDYTPVLCRSEDGMLVGLFLLVPGGGGVTAVHFCFVPGSRWKIVPAGKQFIEWVWRETSTAGLIGAYPDYNRVAARAAKACGFRPGWTENQGQQKDGKPFRLIVTVISRPSYFGHAGADASVS